MIKIRKVICVILSAAAAAACSVMPASAANMLMGDVNNDGKVTLRDATLAQKIDLGLVSALSEQNYVGDMDKSGSITVVDAYLIQRLATRDPDLMDGNSENGIPAFCPNRAKRAQFYDAVNAERASRGLSQLTYTEGMLAAGQELCDAWYEEFSDLENEDRYHYSGYRIVISQYGTPKRFNTVFEDYGISGYTSGAIIDASYGKSQSGKTYFNAIKSDVNKKGENSPYYEVFNDILMKSNVTAICVGEVYTGSSACWVITGF